ncbi:cell division protein ZapA [Pseudoxanthomonas kaohsiungensis]|uniref:Cell division protein ZapA n=1 Tax=Pseudoxanthomonas kaohsiungensis TaxID=283923 RepID=A0ABW3LUB3_9GAMM|nr:cell division protein ZapA [Pseudoxanthomonas kaohsiungensis]KAF1701926.1 cell division protein ZapA [Pseudoxanthomonas kaohsiungensis]
MSNSEPVGVRVLDREYTVGVSAEERDGLLAAARLLDARMRELRGNNRMVALDRIAVLAALNLAHEVQQLRQERESQQRELAGTLEALNRRLDGLLGTSAG